jgi:formylmethanofuran dehydrogenase subunit B
MCTRTDKDPRNCPQAYPAKHKTLNLKQAIVHTGKEKYTEYLTTLITDFSKQATKKLAEYLDSNSNRLTPRENLELAEAFAHIIAGHAEKEPDEYMCQPTEMRKPLELVSLQ